MRTRPGINKMIIGTGTANNIEKWVSLGSARPSSSPRLGLGTSESARRHCRVYIGDSPDKLKQIFRSWGLVSNSGPPNFQSIHYFTVRVRVSLG